MIWALLGVIVLLVLVISGLLVMIMGFQEEYAEERKRLTTALLQADLGGKVASTYSTGIPPGVLDKTNTEPLG